MILLAGAAGSTSRELVGALAAKELRLKALVSDPDKAALSLGAGIELAAGDLSRPETLKPALQNVEKMLLLSSPGPGGVERDRNVIRASKEAGVRHIVKLSALGASPASPINLARWHGLVEQELEGSGVAFTHLRPNWFMSNALRFVPAILAQGAFFAPMGNAKVSMVDVRDVADVAAVVLSEKGHEGIAYSITGPEALSFHDVAAQISQVIGTSVEYRDVTPEEAAARLRAQKVSDWLVEGLVGYYAAFRAGLGSQVTETVPRLARRPGRTFKDFVQSNLKSFGRV